MHFHNSFVFLIFVGRMFLRIKDDVESVLRHNSISISSSLVSCMNLTFPSVVFVGSFPISLRCSGFFRNWWVFHNHLVKRNLRISEVLLSSLLFPSQHHLYGVHLPLCWKFPLWRNFQMILKVYGNIDE